MIGMAGLAGKPVAFASSNTCLDLHEHTRVGCSSSLSGALDGSPQHELVTSEPQALAVQQHIGLAMARAKNSEMAVWISFTASLTP